MYTRKLRWVNNMGRIVGIIPNKEVKEQTKKSAPKPTTSKKQSSEK